MQRCLISLLLAGGACALMAPLPTVQRAVMPAQSMAVARFASPLMAAKKPAKKVVAKKAVAKKAVPKKVVKKAPPKKAPVKKAPPKKVPSKRIAKGKAVGGGVDASTGQVLIT